MVLNEGSLRNNTTGVFTELYIDMQDADIIQHGIVVFHTLNDPVLYVALLPECCWVTKSPPTHTQQALDQCSLFFAKQQQDPPPAQVRKHDWLHMPAFSTITTAGIYLAAPPQSPSSLLIRSLLPPCQEVRHRLVKGEPLGRGTLLHRASFKITHTHRQRDMQRRSKQDSVTQDYVRHLQI